MYTVYINVFGHKIGNNEFKKIFYSSTIIVTLSVLISAFFGYLLQFFLGRMLSIQEFGSFTALLSLTYLVGVPTSVLTASIIKITSELLSKKNWDKLNSLYLKLNLFFLTIGAFVFLIFYFFKQPISLYLNISDTNLLIPFGLFLGFSYILIVPGAYLQGLMRFKAFAFYNVVNGLLRTLIPTSLVFLGFGIYGVFNGFWITAIVLFFISFLLLKKNLDSEKLFKHIDLKENYKRIASFGSSVIFINFGLMALNNFDMIFVKMLFEEETVGYYAGTVTLGKILLFGAGSVGVVMYPQISSLYVEKSKKLFDKFKSFLYVQLLFIFLGLTTFITFPKLLTNLFFGSRFDQSVEYLPIFSIFISLYVLVNFFVLFFMAIDKTKVFLFLIVASVAQVVLLNTFNTTITQIIYVNIFVCASLLLTLGFYFLNIIDSINIKYKK